MKKHNMGFEKEGSRRIIPVVRISCKGMDNSNVPSYYHYYRIARLIGLWAEEESSIRRRRNYVIVLLTGLAIILQTYVLFITDMELPEIMEVMTTYLPTICFTTCYYNLLYNIEILKRIQDHKIRDVAKLDNEDEIKVMNKYGEQSRFYSLIIACVFYLYVGFLFMPSFISLHLYMSDVRNISVLVLPVRWDYYLENKTRYFSMLLLQYVGIVIVSTVGIAYYTMVISSLQHACALFTIVTVKIDRSFKENIYNPRFTKRTFSTNHKKEFEWIVSVIECYNNAVDYVDLLLAASNRSYCVEVIMVLLFFIMDFLHMFRMLDMGITRNEAIQICIYITGTIIIIYSGFYMGQRLIDHSANVYAKCCQIPFYALSIKTQKLLVMFIMRTLKPCSININGMMVTSNEVFAKIANTSYSLAIMCYKTH